MKQVRFVFLFLIMAASLICCSEDPLQWEPADVQPGVPVVDVYVDGQEEIVSKDDYLKATMEILRTYVQGPVLY